MLPQSKPTYYQAKTSYTIGSNPRSSLSSSFLYSNCTDNSGYEQHQPQIHKASNGGKEAIIYTASQTIIYLAPNIDDDYITRQ